MHIRNGFALTDAHTTACDAHQEDQAKTGAKGEHRAEKSADVLATRGHRPDEQRLETEAREDQEWRHEALGADQEAVAVLPEAVRDDDRRHEP